MPLERLVEMLLEEIFGAQVRSSTARVRIPFRLFLVIVFLYSVGSALMISTPSSLLWMLFLRI